jgi:hypothetical protein
MRKANPVSDKAIPTCLLPTSRASRGPPVALTMAANAARLCLQPTSNERSAAARMHCNLRTNIKCDDNAKFLCVLSASNIAKQNGRRSRSAGSKTFVPHGNDECKCKLSVALVLVRRTERYPSDLVVHNQGSCCTASDLLIHFSESRHDYGIPPQFPATRQK